jgi:PKD repeat protein/pimeloyl-ACP methyl ester carboxylesterase
LTLGSSIIELTNTSTSAPVAWQINSTNMNFSGGTSRIRLLGSTSEFSGGSLPYHDVEFQNTGTSFLSGNNTFHDVSFSGNATISGNNTFHNLTLGQSKTYTFASSTTQTLLGNLIANGTAGSPTILNGSGSCTTRISKASGTVCISYCTLNNLCAIGGATFGTQNSVLNSSTGWLSNSCPGVSCAASISPSSISAASVSSGYSVYVNIAPSCSWTVTGVPAWVTWTSPLSGSGSATLGFTVQANPGPDPRSATITVAGEALFISQAIPGCTYSISPANNLSVPAVGVTGQTVAVTAASSCGWTASTNASWITITSGFAGFGNGTVNYNVANNPGTSPRSGTMTVAGQVFQVTQLGLGSTATYTISASCQPEYANFPNTTLPTAPLKICADGSKATWVTVIVTGTGGVPTSALRFKLQNATPDIAFSGAFNNPYSTSVPGQARTRFSHPTYIATGNTPYRTDILEVYEFGNEGVILASCPVRIYRTPVAFVHGLKGNQGTFATLTSDLLLFNRYPTAQGLLSGSPLLFRIDYNSTSLQRFNVNRDVVPNAIDAVVIQAINQGYSCGKAAVFGHSMGGVLSRLYLQSLNSRVYRGDLNRLVSVNTPHRGTQLANYCTQFPPNGACGSAFSLLALGAWANPVGAILDLRVNSTPIRRMNLLPQWNTVPCAALSSDQVGDNSASATALRLAMTFAYSPLFGNIFDSEAHDLVVPSSSQTSGFAGYPTADQQWHIGSAANYDIIDRIELMLDANPANPAFYSQNGFPQGVLNYFTPIAEEQFADIADRDVPSIEILSPSPGTVYSPNSIVTVDISFADITNMALIVSGGSIDPIAIDTVAVDQLSFQIPANAIGTLSIFLLGGDGTDWTVSDDTFITISSPSVPDSIVCSPNTVTHPLGLTQYIQASGFFGSTIPVALYGSPSLNIDIDGAFLAHNGNGVFQALSVGSTEVVFEYLGVTDTVQFTIVDDPNALLAGFDYTTEEPCVNAPVVFTDQSQGLVLSRLWSFPGGIPATSTDSIPQVSYSTPGTYPVTLITTFINGVDTLTLDSLITVVPGPDLTISSGGTLIANESSPDATYQWVNCDDGNALIPGATDQEFAPSVNGNYAVIVSNGLCVGTTSCEFFGTTGLSGIDLNGIRVNPNPTRGAFVVVLPTISPSVRVEVKDVSGRLVLQDSFSDVRQLNLQLDEPPGVYMLHVYLGDERTTIKLVKN